MERMLKQYLLSITVSTLYTTIPQNLLIKVLNEIISPVFDFKKKQELDFKYDQIHPKELTNNFLHSNF